MKGNTSKSLDYELENLKILKEKLSVKAESLIPRYASISKKYTKIGNHFQAEAYLLLVITELSNLKIDRKNIFSVKNYVNCLIEIGNYYIEKVDYKYANHYYYNALKLNEIYKVGLEGEIYNLLSKACAAQNNYSKAIGLSSLSISSFEKKLQTKKHHIIARRLLDIARLHQKQNNLNKSLQSIQSALIALSQTFESQDWRDNPSVSEVFSKKDLLETLDFKAGLLLDLAKKQPEYLTAAYKTAQLAAGLIDTIRADYNSDFDKQYLAEWSYGVYEKAINTAYLMYDKTKDARYKSLAFNVLERSKAIVLLEALKSGQAEMALSDDDRNKLYQYKAELQKIEKQIYDETTQNKKAPDDPSVRTLQNHLFDTRRQYEALVKSFETRYPDYYKVKYNQNFVQLKDVQALLPKDGSAIALEYFVGDHDIFTFLITHTDYQIFKKEKPKDIEQRVEWLRQSITSENPQSQTQFINQAAWLYDLILKDALCFVPHNNLPPSVRNDIDLKVKKLIIVPDGILSYIPFEMLLNGSRLENNSWSNMPFLIKQYSISYANSGNLLSQQMQKKEQQARNLFAGFASQYKPNEAPMIAIRAALTRDNAYDLPNAKEEVETIQALIGGSLFTYGQSNEHNFKQLANEYRILHFAMHAMSDSLNPMLSKLLFTFNAKDTTEDNDLTVSELYTMHLNADLAILSACQTGYGIINRGEGVLSLSRAFAYAGVPATVMSLWRVPDKPTSLIMIDFYKNLKKNQPKDEALRNAKLSYLERYSNNDEQNPFYWAGFVAVGNMSPIDMTPPYQNFLIGSLILLAFVSLILWLRRIVNS